MKIKPDSSFFNHFFFSFLIVDPGHFPGPQLHPLQKCIHISHTVMDLLIGPAEAGKLSRLSKCQVHPLSFTGKPNASRSFGCEFNNWPCWWWGEGGRTDWEFLSEVPFLHLPTLTTHHHSFCWVPVLLEVMTVESMPLKMCLLYKREIIHQVSIAPIL